MWDRAFHSSGADIRLREFLKIREGWKVFAPKPRMDGAARILQGEPSDQRDRAFLLVRPNDSGNGLAKFRLPNGFEQVRRHSQLLVTCRKTGNSPKLDRLTELQHHEREISQGYAAKRPRSSEERLQGSLTRRQRATTQELDRAVG